MDGAKETPMEDHIARFWQLLQTEHVRILIDIRRDTSSVVYWDSSSFSNEVAKALVAQRGTSMAVICGACGDVWQDGMTCGQKNNGFPFPTCYPHTEARPFAERTTDERNKIEDLVRTRSAAAVTSHVRQEGE